jgi:hypothetical protein
MPHFASSIKRLIRENSLAGELYVLGQRLRQPKQRTVMIFPDQMYTGTAGDLRACAVGRALRKFGWRPIIVPPWLGETQRRRFVRQISPDVILLQQSRHPLNRPSLYPGIPCVFDADDADILNQPDIVAPCCRESAAVIAGNHFLAGLYRQYNSDVTVIWTGTYITSVPGSKPNDSRAPVITWAASDPFGYQDEAASHSISTAYTMPMPLPNISAPFAPPALKQSPFPPCATATSSNPWQPPRSVYSRFACPIPSARESHS